MRNTLQDMTLLSRSNKKSKLMLDLNSQQGAFNCDTKVLFQNKITSLIQ